MDGRGGLEILVVFWSRGHEKQWKGFFTYNGAKGYTLSSRGRG